MTRAGRLRSWLPALLFLVASVPAVVWVPWGSYFRATSYDGENHLWRTVEMARIWPAQGLVPGWAPDVALGLGSPLFMYYGSLPYVLGAAAMGVGLTAASAVELVLVLSLVGGGAGAALLASRWYGDSPSRRWAALLAGLAYLYAPYVVANAARRAALGETFALGLAPWVLRAVLGCLQPRVEAKQGRLSVATLALSASALVTSHPLSALATAVLAVTLAGASLVRRPRNEQIAAIARLAAAGALAAGISAFFLLPLVAHYSDVQLERARGAGDVQTFASQFIAPTALVLPEIVHDYSKDVPGDVPPLQPHLGLVQVALALTGLVWTLRRWRDPRTLWLVGAAAVTLFLISPWSRRLWEASGTLQSFQFPWRFMGPLSLVGALAVGGLAAHRRGSTAVAVVLGLALVVAGGWPRVEPIPWRAAWQNVTDMHDYEQWSGEVGLTSNDEFAPRTAARGRRDLGALVPAPAGPVAPSALRLIDASPTGITLASDAAAPSTVVLDWFYFPSWRATLDGAEIAPRPSGDLGLLALDLPPGQHVVEARVGPRPLQIVGGWITAATLAIVLLLLVGRRATAPPSAAAALILLAVMTFLSLRGPSARTTLLTPAAASPETPVRVLGALVDQSVLAATGRLRVETVLQITSPPSGGRTLRARALGAGGRVLATSDLELGGPTRPPGTWQANMLLRQEHEWVLPRDAGPGEITIELGVDGYPPVRLGALTVGPVGAIDAPALHPPRRPMGDLPARWRDGTELEQIDVRERGGAALPNLRLADGGAVANGLDARLFLRRVVDSPVDTTARLALLDPRGDVWAEADAPVHLDAADDRAYRSLQLALPADLPPSYYRLELFPEPNAAALEVGAREVLLDCDCLPPGAVPIAARMEQGISLLGARRAVVGDALVAVAYWQASAPTSASYTAFLHLLAPDGRLVAQYDDRPYGDRRPTTGWRTGELVPFAARLVLPAEGPFALRAGFYGADPGDRLRTTGGRPEVSLGLVERPRPFQRDEVALEEGVALAGHRFERRGDQVTLALYWRAEHALAERYTVFVHALDAAGRIVAQADGPPELGERTTAEWASADTILDPHAFTAVPGQVARVEVGLYRPTDGRRLRLASGGDAVDLGSPDAGP